ncbi:SCO family protein [Ensifer sp. LCM 4579]|uniref:SCO family protein n=1 Tax=Ensifer sp. LCM 4579 TaxID=1848292 RepID=UPI0008DAD5A5|nr:SCO family protein [Ensifer sp. LCM 4579]OHV80983.1 electron transporter SenC [Ensifer sp. LCM 4579]
MRQPFLLLIIIGLTCASSAALAFDPFKEARIDQRPGAQVPLDLVFRDQAGGPTSLRQLAQGKPIVLAPVLHHCPNICGVTLSGLAEAISLQGFVPGRDFTVVAFGIDPQEGPEDALKAVEDLTAGSPKFALWNIHALTGDARAVAAVTGALGYRYAWDERIGQYAHIAAVAVLTPGGRLARWLYGIAPQPRDLRLALTEAGRGEIGTWQDQLLLLCYHYDPVTGRYGALISWLLRLGGGLTVLLGAGFIGMALVYERRIARRGPR